MYRIDLPGLLFEDKLASRGIPGPHADRRPARKLSSAEQARLGSSNAMHQTADRQEVHE